MPRPERGELLDDRHLDDSDRRFLEALHVRQVAMWSQLRNEEKFGQALIAAEEERLVPQRLLEIRKQGRRKLFVITTKAEKLLDESRSPESRETAEFVVTDRKTKAEMNLDAYSQSLTNPRMIRNFYSSSFARSMVLDAFNLFRELHMEDGKPVRRGRTVAEIRIKADFSDIPPTKGFRVWRNLPVFPPKSVAKWIVALYSMMTESRSIREVIGIFERTAVKTNLSDQTILLGFSKLRSLWETGIYNRAKLRTRLMKLSGRGPDRGELTMWLLFFDVLNASYLRLNRQLTHEGFKKGTWRLTEAYSQTKREHPQYNKDHAALFEMLKRWREIAMQTIRST